VINKSFNLSYSVGRIGSAMFKILQNRSELAGWTADYPRLAPRVANSFADARSSTSPAWSDARPAAEALPHGPSPSATVTARASHVDYGRWHLLRRIEGLH